MPPEAKGPDSLRMENVAHCALFGNFAGDGCALGLHG